MVSRSHCRSDFGLPRRPNHSRQIRSIDLSALSTRSGGAALLTALTLDGLALIKTDWTSTFEAAYIAAASFFAEPFEVKVSHGAGNGPGQSHGYMSYLDEEAGSECFECKAHYDDRFLWPRCMEEGLLPAFTALRQVSTCALEAVCCALGRDTCELESLLDVKSNDMNTTSATVDLRTCSQTALRVWRYTNGHRRGCGWHVDNSMLTVAPKGTAVGAASTLEQCLTHEP